MRNGLINITHRCIDCGYDVFTRKPNMIDGLRCPECQGPLAPILGRKDGLNEQEGRAMDALITAWNEFLRLGKQHPSDMNSFCNGIHQCQQVLCMRVLQRDYPEGYPIK